MFHTKRCSLVISGFSELLLIRRLLTLCLFSRPGSGTTHYESGVFYVGDVCLLLGHAPPQSTGLQTACKVRKSLHLHSEDGERL